MRTIPLVLVLVVVAGGLFGLWRLLSDAGVEPAGGPGAEVFARENDAVALEAGGPDDRGREGARADGAVQPFALEGPTASEPGEAADEAEPPPILTGRIVTAGGDPIEGASVFAATGFEWFVVPLDIEPDSVASRHAGAKVATTGPDGRFAFTEGLEPGHLRLAVRAAGHEPHYDEKGRLPSDLPHDLGDIALAPGVVLAGRVVDLKGEPVAGARLLQSVERGLGGMTVTVPGRGIPLGETDAEGRFLVDELSRGPWRILVDAPGYLVREESGRAEESGERHEGLEFVVEPGAAIRGTLRGAPQEELARFRVEARVKEAEREGQTDSLGAGPEPEAPSEYVNPRVRTGRPDASGAFTVSGLGARTAYKLTVWELDEARERWKRFRGVEPVVAWPGTGGVELEYAPESSLLFQVVDATTRAPVEEFEAWAGPGRRPGVLKDDDGEVLRVHPEGRVRFAGLRPGPAGSTVGLEIRAAGYALFERKDIALANGKELDLATLALEPAPTVRVHVVDAATEAPVTEARVFMTKTEEARSYSYYLGQPDASPVGVKGILFDRTDEAGVAVLPTLPGEECNLVVSAAGFMDSEAISLLVAGTADHEETVRLARGGTALVSVVDTSGQPVSGVPVDHREVRSGANQDDDSMTYFMPDEGKTSTDAQGFVRIPNLQPGEYEFRIREEGQGMVFFARGQDDSEGWERATLREGEVTELTLTTEPRGRLEGFVTEAGAPLSGASLRLQKKESDERRQYFLMGGSGGSRFSALTGHGGRFEFHDVTSGEYTLSVDHPDREMTHVLDVTIQPESTELTIDLPVAIIEGRVTDKDGRPLSGVEVSVQGRRRNRVNVLMPDGATMYESDTGEMRTDVQSPRKRRKHTDASGRYSLRGVATGAPLTVSVESDFHVGDRRDSLELEPDEILRDVDFELEPAGRIEVVLSKDAGGNAEGYVRIRASQVVPEGQGSISHQTGIYAGKSQTLSAILPGRWQVRAFRRQGEVEVDYGTQEVEVAAGETARVTFQVP